MRGFEHLAIAGVTTGVALFAVGRGHVELAAPTLAAVSAAGIGSLVPDIDHPKAWISNRIPITLLSFGLVLLLWFEFTKRSVFNGSSTGTGAALGAPLLDMARPLIGWAWLSLALGVVLLSVAMMVATFVEHRGPTHSLTVAAALTLIACLGFALATPPWTLGLWFGWGYLSHLLADLTTSMGCPALLWPWREGDLAMWRGGRPDSLPLSRSAATGSMAPSWSMFADGGSGILLSEDHEGHLAPPAAHLPESDEAARKRRSPVHQHYSEMAMEVEGCGERSVSKAAVTAVSSTPAGRLCPKCGGALIMRKARRGAHAGNKFFGCANYPKCRYIENLVD